LSELLISVSLTRYCLWNVKANITIFCFSGCFPCVLGSSVAPLSCCFTC